jgi:hypothetical protein
LVSRQIVARSPKPFACFGSSYLCTREEATA